MIVTAWNNGAHHQDGNGYGVKINPHDRDTYFVRRWGKILLELEGEAVPVEINIDKDGFWNDTCRELISVQIGKWLIKNKLVLWNKDYPPRLNLVQIEDRRFRLSR